ncbi:hypothetical protein JCM11251_002340 [Rhodosporidiobolus azoricus]
MATVDTGQLAATLRAQLSAYLVHVGTINATLKDVNQIQTELDVEHKPISLVKDRLDKAYDLLGTQSEEEISRIDAALETVTTLEILTNAAAEAHSGKNRAQPNKKRKVDASVSSRAGSPASSAAPSPMPAYSNAGSPPNLGAPLPRSNSVKPQPILPSQPVLLPQPAPIVPASTNYKKPSIKHRKDALLAQLPLKPGRQIAVKESKKSAPGAPAIVSDNFILGRVVQCIQGDKNRYSVEDVDYDPTQPTPDGGKWNTTLKSIIPLPQPGDRSTYPDYDFPPGTGVLACYPETTSFYKAIVEAGPFDVPIAGGGKKKETQRLYRLRFDDDDGALRDVPLELVCEPPLA